MSAEGPRRLRDGGDEPNGLLRRALEAERTDAADEARLARIGHAIAFAGASAAPPSPPPAQLSPSAATTASQQAASSLATKGRISASMSTWGPYALLAAAVIGGLAFIGTTESPSAPVSSAARTTVAPVPAIEESSTPSTPTFSPSDLPTAPPAPAPPAAKPSKAAVSGPATAGDEIALLAKAHDALRSDPARSLAICKEHESRFATGHFAQEREAVAIEALIYLGRRGEAARRWTEFQRRYPSSSHRVHLESLFAAPPAP